MLLKITVVDDDPLHGEVLRRVFAEHSDLDVTYFQGASEALEELERTRRSRLPHLLLLDLRMPGLDGHAMQERLCAHPLLSNVPVVVLSGSTLEVDRQRSYELGASLYLPKPDELSQLRRLIAHLLGLWQFVLPRPGGAPAPSVVT